MEELNSLLSEKISANKFIPKITVMMKCYQQFLDAFDLWKLITRKRDILACVIM